MPTVNLGRIRPIHRGEYSGATAYKPLDLVNYNSAVYLCTDNTTGVPPTNPAFWASLFDPNSAIAPDFINALTAAVKFATEQGYLANLGVTDLRQVSQQQGEFTIQNRGIVNGCIASKSVTATRNLSLAAGTVFAFGRSYAVADQANAASVPANPGSGSATVQAYLWADAFGVWALAVTAIGQTMPSSAIKLYNITIPAGSTDATDPNLAAVSLSDVRRLEPEFPQLLNSPASASVVLKMLRSADYFLDFDIASAVGSPCLPSNVIKSSRATNGFTVMLASAADDVVIRWRLSQLSN